MTDAVLFAVLGGLAGLLVGGALAAIVLNARITRLSADRARLDAELLATRRSADEQKAILVQSHQQLREAFTALSTDALRENRQDFLRNADALLAPVRDTLNKVQDRLVDVDRAREGSYRAVAAQLTELSKAQRELRESADGLSRSLRSPNARGKWGEIQLRRIVELAGMAPYCDFEEKPSTESDDGTRLTPDLLVRLPGDATIVVDAKVPIDGYLAAAEAKTDAERQSKCRHVRLFSKCI